MDRSGLDLIVRYWEGSLNPFEMHEPYITLYPLIGYFTLRVANAINS